MFLTRAIFILTGEEISISEWGTRIEALQEMAKQNWLRCPHCRELLRIACLEKTVFHFRHRTKGPPCIFRREEQAQHYEDPNSPIHDEFERMENQFLSPDKEE